MSANWHNQKHVARCQLERAIELFLDEQDYYSAATLAGASEEILGKLRERTGMPHALSNLRNRLRSMLTEEEYKAIDEKKGLLSLLNEYRNWLKHFSEDEELFIDSKAAAFDLIDRAHENWIALGEEDSAQMLRFREHSSGRNV